MSNVKGKGQRLIPEELLKYLEAYKTAHPDPTVGGGATLDDIVDSQGNKRFIEGEGVNSTNPNITTLYNRWSLSGTHLMCVVVFKIGSTNIPNLEILSKYVLPEFIMNKIIPDSAGLVYNIYAGANNLRVGVQVAGDELQFINYGTTYTNSQYRIQCDLLIDADYSE